MVVVLCHLYNKNGDYSSLNEIEQQIPTLLQYHLDNHNTHDKKMALIGYYLLTKCAAILDLNYFRLSELQVDQEGKPTFSKGPFVNICHYDNMVTVALHTKHQIGIAVEKFSPPSDNKINVHTIKKFIDVNRIKENTINKALKYLMSDLIEVSADNVVIKDGMVTYDNHQYHYKTKVASADYLVTVVSSTYFNMDIRMVDYIE